MEALVSRYVPRNAVVTKRRVDRLFVVHATVMALLGSFGFLFPHALEWFMVHAGQKLALRSNTVDQKLPHTLVRVYAALVLSQAWIVWKARAAADANMRRCLVQAYAVAFALTALALLRAQLTESADTDFNSLNWMNILVFSLLAAWYGWFACVERIAVFEGLDKSMQ